MLDIIASHLASDSVRFARDAERLVDQNAAQPSEAEIGRAFAKPPRKETAARRAQACQSKFKSPFAEVPVDVFVPSEPIEQTADLTNLGLVAHHLLQTEGAFLALS